MRTIRAIEEMQATSRAYRQQGRSIGLVPTMGYLHAGHMSLIQIARERADVVVVSIFVNPTQFGPNEDLATYPRDFERDEDMCREAGVDIVFYPPVEEMYAPDATVAVVEDKYSKILCGASRPGHFRGVLTVVAKLFNIVQPDLAVFGQKDAQQLWLIQRMVRDLNFPVEIVGGEIVREADGLAMSSRNTRLKGQARKDALCLREALDLAEEMHGEGERSARTIKHAMLGYLATVPAAELDYVEIVDWNTLEPVETLKDPALVALAVRVGGVRLIDNTVLGE
ncbi:MAG: pantoate--beta-alanine ligase [Kiritimatiellae bacterium]|nr:pantoate--beta-alanine ligase [Kiritimatiellia bacterium]